MACDYLKRIKVNKKTCVATVMVYLYKFKFKQANK